MKKPAMSKVRVYYCFNTDAVIINYSAKSSFIDSTGYLEARSGLLWPCESCELLEEFDEPS